MTDRKPKKAKRSKALFRSPVFKISLAAFLVAFISVSATFLYFYVEYSRIIDRRLNGEIFKNTAKLYATPYRIYPGQKLSPEQVVSRLQRAGFETTDKGIPGDGVYEVNGNHITIQPTVGDPLRLDFQKDGLNRVLRLSGKKSGVKEVNEAWLPAEVVTTLFDESRTKRRLVEFKEMPPYLVNALVAAEDKRFYHHYGLDPIRLVGAVVDAIRRQDRVEGTSTLTQQLARNFFLTLDRRAGGGFDRSPGRKLREAFIAVLLEQRLTKNQILTMYANEVYLGNRGSFSINGFGEGANTYFGKDIGELTLPEAAMLASIIPSPNAYSPITHPDRAKSRRNLVLSEMFRDKMITAKEYELAKTSEVKVAPLKLDATGAPYLVDFIREELTKDYSDEALISGNLKIYTTLDPDLQRAAVDAVEKGMKVPLEEIARRNKNRKDKDQLPDPQAALIALDPHTGEIKAMVGGTNYGASQYNRITQAFRQPGSIFKPFVYAAAFETAFDNPERLTETPAEPPKTELPASAEAAPLIPMPQIMPLSQSNVITAVTTLVDEPTTFTYEGDRTYEPNNFHQQYRGIVTVREALWHSLNVPTIKIAERIGYDRVAALAKRAGLNAKIKGYPSVALGSFEVTPIEMAGAYTIFANEGKRMEPHALVRVASTDDKLSKSYKYEPAEIIRPELAYLMTHLMEGVLTNGTGVGVRGRGFQLPAAGKTGTSRDGWFAGYTKDLLVIAWVGYDDNRDLNLEGAHSALPIWTEFMLKAYQLYPPRDVDAMEFEAPRGIDFVRLDSESLALAGPSCPDTFQEAFISGTAPTNFCPLHGFHFSQTFGSGIEAIGTGTRATGTAVGKAAKGIGRFFGGLFGRSDNADRSNDSRPSRPTPY
jgi:penicillin-binding protein 1B